MIYLLTILYTLSDVMYSKYQFIDGRTGAWHAWRLVRVIVFFAALLCYQYFPFQWEDIIVCGVINAALFDIGINVIALQMPVFYVGNTSGLDITFKKVKWFVYVCAAIAALVLKFIIK